MEINYVSLEKISTPNRKEVTDFYGYGGEKNGREYECCLCCGKPVYLDKNPKMLHLFTNGMLTDYDGCLGKDKDQGWFYVGNSCYRKFLKMKKEDTIENISKMY